MLNEWESHNAKQEVIESEMEAHEHFLAKKHQKYALLSTQSIPQHRSK
jgi:hypothetical protein